MTLYNPEQRQLTDMQLTSLASVVEGYCKYVEQWGRLNETHSIEDCVIVPKKECLHITFKTFQRYVNIRVRAIYHTLDNIKQVSDINIPVDYYDVTREQVRDLIKEKLVLMCQEADWLDS